MSARSQSLKVFKEASATVKKEKNKKGATLSTVNSKLFYIFPPKTCCSLSVQITSLVQTEVTIP
jgi:hypothetical protein